MRWRGSRLRAMPLLLAALVGCGHEPAQQGKDAVVVIVSKPLRDTVTDYEYYNGRIAAPESVDVRARVSGYLSKVSFKEGEEVKKGQKLFEIDRRPYQAVADQATADREKAKASAKTAAYEMVRQEDLLQRKATSKAEYDKAVGSASETIASVRAAEASLKRAELDLDYTLVTAEIDGRIGRYNITPGNLVVADQTLLTTIVSVDPMYAYFPANEQSVLRFLHLIRDGKIKSARETEIPVGMGLAGEDDYPNTGVINFVDNKIDPNTGTLALRGTFDNPLKNKTRLLTAGMFCRVRLPVGDPVSSLLVSDRAVGSEQGQKFLLVVDDKNQVQMRPVELGPRVKGLRVIEKGLKDDESVIVVGAQRVRPGLTVEPRAGSMIVEPSRSGGPEAKAAPTPGEKK